MNLTIKKYWPILLCGMMFFVLHSCASSPDVYAKIDSIVNTGSFENALIPLYDESGTLHRRLYTPKNLILLYLDRGMINHFAGRYRDSSDDLQTAELLIEQAFTKSISQEIGSYILNDNTKDYSGEDYEDLYINIFNSLNYFHSGNSEGALVEIRRLNEKLNYLADKYETAAKKVTNSDSHLDTRQLPVEAARFSNSALARYMGLLLYRGTGRNDSARIDYEELFRAYSLAPEVYYHPVPSSVENELAVPSGKARLNILAFTGLAPVINEQNILIPLPFAFPNNTARLALPAMVNRANQIERAEAVLDTGEIIPLELLEDMGAVARETFKSKYSLTVLKTTARAIAKVTTSAGVASYVTERQGRGLGALVGVLGRVLTEASEQADTRLSRYFPCYALVGGVNLNPGSYVITVNFYGRSGLINSQRREINVRLDKLNLEEFICLR